VPGQRAAFHLDDDCGWDPRDSENRENEGVTFAAPA
jgi:hypothetical protein